MRIFVLLLLISVTTYGYAGDMRLNIGYGRGDIELSREFQFENGNAGKNSLAGVIYLGYITSSHVIFDLGVSKVTDDFPFLLSGTDNVHFDSYEALIGYQFRSGHIYIEPKLGYSKWKIDLEEGWIFNPGEEERRKGSGSDMFSMVTAGYRFGETFGLSLSYKHQEFDYGKVGSVLVGLDFAF